MREGISPNAKQKGCARQTRATGRDIELKKQISRTLGEDRRGERGRRGWNRAIREAGAELVPKPGGGKSQKAASCPERPGMEDAGESR